MLNGAIAGLNKLVETSQVKHLLQQSNDRALAQLCSIYPNSALGTINSEVCLEADLVKLLRQFEFIFSEPKVHHH